MILGSLCWEINSAAYILEPSLNSYNVLHSLHLSEWREKIELKISGNIPLHLFSPPQQQQRKPRNKPNGGAPIIFSFFFLI